MRFADPSLKVERFGGILNLKTESHIQGVFNQGEASGHIRLFAGAVRDAVDDTNVHA
jgi:molybdopterin synthase catalytic subunit